MSITLLIGMGCLFSGATIVLLSLSGVEFANIISFGMFEP